MTYKELLQLYKSGQLSTEQREQVEFDIEKQEAIGEYLFENDGIPEFSDMDIQEESTVDESGFDEKRFLKMIKKSIRRAFVKMGVAVGVIILAIVLIANTALPYIVDACYYNPAKVMGEGKGFETNQMSLDTAVYTELFTPGYYRTKAEVNGEGYGKYDICIPQNVSVNGKFRDIYGTVEKGRMTLFGDGLFKLPVQNAFVSDGVDGFSGYIGTGAAGTAENAMKKLNELDDTDYYVGYITLDKVMTYDELVAWSEVSGIVPDWCAVCRQQDIGEYIADNIIGFNYSSSCAPMVYDNETYPYLNYYDLTEAVDNYPEDFSAQLMETHMVSMLRYMMDNKDFRDMVGCVTSDYEFGWLKDSIEENGLHIYGFTVVAQKDKLIEISQNENVYYMYTTALI